MNNPSYLAVVPKEAVQKTVEEGVPGTAMPGYSAKAGGMLTDEQINILVSGIYQWAKGREAPADNGTQQQAGAARRKEGGKIDWRRVQLPAQAAGSYARGLYVKSLTQCAQKAKAYSQCRSARVVVLAVDFA